MNKIGILCIIDKRIWCILHYGINHNQDAFYIRSGSDTLDAPIEDMSFLAQMAVASGHQSRLANYLGGNWIDIDVS